MYIWDFDWYHIMTYVINESQTFYVILPYIIMNIMDLFINWLK